MRIVSTVYLGDYLWELESIEYDDTLLSEDIEFLLFSEPQ